MTADTCIRLCEICRNPFETSTARPHRFCGRSCRGKYAMPTRSLDLRFWEKVDKSNECWTWKASLTPAGYGSFWDSGKCFDAHKMSYRLTVGEPPDGLELDHVCHSRDRTCSGGPTCLHRRCVNPTHLEPVTHEKNMRRGVLARRTQCPSGHTYNDRNTYRDSRGRRTCRLCNLVAVRQYKLRKSVTP